jgi:hypothetical protein
MKRNGVIIGRKWADPNIYYEVTDEGIELNMALPDFVGEVQKELGYKTMHAAYEIAVLKVIDRIKKESARVMS